MKTHRLAAIVIEVGYFWSSYTIIVQETRSDHL